ncbi:hypothetical protein F2P79_014884 [Pimephales promelas]|nr:hypothetical protein F2P79_014884 [Pimephales promelas]
MAEIHDISIPAQSHQRLRALSQEQLTKTGPDTSQPRSPAQRTRTPPRKEPHRPGAQGCNAEDDNDPELPKEVERLQTALSNFLHRLKKNKLQHSDRLQHDWKGGGHTHKLPLTSLHISAKAQELKRGVEKPAFHNISDNYKTVTFHLLSPTGEHDTDTIQDRPGGPVPSPPAPNEFSVELTTNL